MRGKKSHCSLDYVASLHLSAKNRKKVFEKLCTSNKVNIFFLEGREEQLLGLDERTTRNF